MASAFFTPKDQEIIKAYPIEISDEVRNRLPLENFDQYISSAASSQDALNGFMVLLTTLYAQQPARRITYAATDKNLGEKLLEFAVAWYNKEVFRETLRTCCSSLLEKVATKTSDLEVWIAVAKLLNEFDPSVTPTQDYGMNSVQINEKVVQDLKNDWKSYFVPTSLDVLKETIREFERQPKNERDKFYSKTLIFIQSSGMGKSRLADAFGKCCPMINYVLREKNTLGFPPPDPEILSTMRINASKIPSNPSRSSVAEILQESVILDSQKEYEHGHRADAIWFHSLAVGVLQASFEIFTEWVVKQPDISLEELANLRHKNMAYNSKLKKSSGYRSAQRIEFCDSVAIRAKDIATGLVHNANWRRLFDNDNRGRVRSQLTDKGKHKYIGGLLKAAKGLMESLRRFKSRERDDPRLVIVFDEASSLLKLEGKQGIHSGRYIALNRIISCLTEYPIWFFIISTESQVGTLLPPNNVQPTHNYAEDPSLRFVVKGQPQLKRIPPFLALQLDMQDQYIMQHSTRSKDELIKTLSDFGKLDHMAMFGRRLWFAYIKDPKAMNDVAKAKLIGGVQKGSYEPANENHIFAALSFRLSLDPCMYNAKAIPLIRTAVNSYMRVVISIDQDIGTMDTITPSEPILAKAAMEYLCIGYSWPASINTLVRELLEKGLVEKGLKGELYVRLLLILAHDWVRLRQFITSDPEHNPKFMKSLTVRNFLEALYTEKYHESIKGIDAKILEARMNFTHFVPTCENLHPSVLSDLLPDLLRRSAALQLAPNQPTYDILIPIYFGKEKERLDRSKCGVIVIQVKNKSEATTVEAVLGENFETTEPQSRKTKPRTSERDDVKFVFNKMANPVLFLLFDLGAEKISPAFEVSYSSSDTIPQVWAIQSRGHDSKVFRCLTLMHCEAEAKLFFISTVLGISKHDQLTQKNKRFYKLRREYRYSPVIGDNAAEKNKDEDTPAEDEDDKPPKKRVRKKNKDRDPLVEDEDNKPPKKRRRRM